MGYLQNISIFALYWYKRLYYEATERKRSPIH